MQGQLQAAGIRVGNLPKRAGRQRQAACPPGALPAQPARSPPNCSPPAAPASCCMAAGCCACCWGWPCEREGQGGGWVGGRWQEARADRPCGPHGPRYLVPVPCTPTCWPPCCSRAPPWSVSAPAARPRGAAALLGRLPGSLVTATATRKRRGELGRGRERVPLLAAALLLALRAPASSAGCPGSGDALARRAGAACTRIGVPRNPACRFVPLQAAARSGGGEF